MSKHYLPSLRLNKQQLTSNKETAVGKECILFPTYAFRNPKVPSEWIIQSRGWAVSFERELDLKQKLIKFAARCISGKLSTNSTSNQLFDRRFKYFLAKGNRRRHINLQVVDEKGNTVRPYSLQSSGKGFFSKQLYLPDCKPQTKLWLHEASYRNRDRRCRRPLGLFDGYIDLTEPFGLSVISDIDDTIKQTHVTSGARAVMSTTFFDPSQCVPGMAEKYRQWYASGVSFHYVSNSPIQLTKTLLCFFQDHQFPLGSLHLKEFQHILSELTEPVGQAKVDAIRSILKDFPYRQFVLIGDSGEADIDVYTQIATEYPKQIAKIFIRHVPLPEDSKVDHSEPISDNHTTELEQMTTNSGDIQGADDRSEQQESIKPVANLAGLMMKPSLAEPIGATLFQASTLKDDLAALNERIAEAQKSLSSTEILMFEHADELVLPDYTHN